MSNVSKVAVAGMVIVIGLSLLATWYALGRKHICPAHDNPDYPIAPCVCDLHLREIRCGGHEPLDLPLVMGMLNNFTSESEKHFNRFILNNTAVTSLPADVFGTFSFEDIRIHGSPIRRIHRHAFRGTAKRTVTLMIDSLPIDKDPKAVTELFTALRRFIRAERITLRNNTLEAVPDNAFNYEVDDFDGNDDGLSIMSLEIFNDKIETLGRYAFVHFPNVTHLSLNNNELHNIRNHSFAFDQRRTNTLDVLKIDLSNNWLESESFDSYAFDELNRRAFLDLSDNMIEYISQEVFETFLDEAPQNSIQIDENPLKCNNCGNAWLIEGRRKYHDRILGALCNDTIISLWDYTTDRYRKLGCNLTTPAEAEEENDTLRK